MADKFANVLQYCMYGDLVRIRETIDNLGKDQIEAIRDESNARLFIYLYSLSSNLFDL